jgi:hypothetical protein
MFVHINPVLLNSPQPRIVASGPSGWAGLIPQSGLVNAWPFDNTYTTSSVATDPIGGKNAALTSVTLNGSGPSTNLNNAGVFNGTSSTGLTALAGLQTAVFTVSIWLYTASALAKRPMASDNPGTVGFDFIVYTGATSSFVVGNGSTNANVGIANMSASSWTMLTITYDGTNFVAYQNGTSFGGGGTLTGLVTNSGNNVAFGFNPAYSGDYWPGKIAGVAIWNRALSSGEVSSVFAL